VLLLIPVIILIALYVTTLFIGRPYIVRGASMYPTLHEGDRVFVMNYKFGSTPNRGDVVVLKNIVQQPELLIKRVVAIGGDRLTVENGRLVVNDKYVHKSVNTSVSHPFTELIPDNTVFVMGDNESRSYDSRVFGPVMLNKVVGRAIFIFWPPGDLTKL
jgi:signal peptidase I